MNCEVCGTEIPEGFKFCSECGAPVPQNKVCPSCKTEVPMKMKFCFNCGYNFEKQSTSNMAGIAMGDKNVVAGDIVGKREDYNITGGATIIKNSDETKKVLQCHICGRHVTILEAHTCPVCGETICDSCYDKTAGMCNNCKTNNKASSENEYREALRKVYEDGRVDLTERRALEALQSKLGLSDAKAQELENAIRFGDSSSESFTTMEKLTMEDVTENFYGKGDVAGAYELMRPIYEKHLYDERVLELYLPILEEYNPDEALNIIASMKADMLSAYLAQIDIYTKNDLSEAERKLDTAERLWPDSLLLKCRRIIWLYKMYLETNRDMFLTQVKSLTNGLPEATTKLERTWKFKCTSLIAEENKKITEEECAGSDIYFSLAKLNTFNKAKSEVVVSQDGNGDTSSILEALDMITEGGTIYLKSGTYNEIFDINKEVEIIGDGTESSFISIKTGTICKVNANASIKNVHFMNTNTVKKDSSEFGMVEIKADCSFESCEFSGSYDSNIMVSGEKTKPSIKNCKFYNARRNGIYLTESSEAVIENCDSYENENQGLSISGKVNPIVSNCNFYSNTKSGIYLSTNTTGKYTNCKIYKNGLTGIETCDNSNPYFEGCESYDGNSGGIASYGNSTGKYVNCKMHNNKLAGMFIYGSANPLVENCEAYDGTAGGFYIYESGKGTLKNCKVHGNGSSGILVSDNANPYIEGCESYNGESGGIASYGNSTGRYLNCKMHNNKLSGMFIYGSGNPIVENCESYDGVESGFYIYESGKGTLKNCKVHGNGSSGILVSDNANPYIEGCECYDGENGGITSKGNSTGRYVNCKMHNNKLAGMFIYGSGNPIVENCEAYNGIQGGFFIYESGKGTFRNCKSHHNTLTGIEVKDTAKPVIDSCEVYNNNSDGIYLHGSCGGTVSNCNTHNNNGYGIRKIENAVTTTTNNIV